MAFGNLYTVGLASTDPASPPDLTKIYGNGTLWGTGTGNVRAGDTFEHAGVQVTILSVEGDEELTLAYAWPGSTFTDDEYVIRQESPLRHTASELAGRTNDMLSALYIRKDQAAIFAVEEFGVNTPPVGYDVGQQLVVGTAPTGDFTGHANEIAQKTVNGWAFYTPAHGWITVAVDTNIARTWNSTGGAWSTTGSLLGAPVWSGAWSAATTYQPGNLVTRLNKVYAANTTNLNKAPESNPTDWTLFLTVGEHGGAVTIAYNFRTATTAATADTAGQANLNAAPASATVLRLNKVDAYGNDWTTTLSSLADGTSTRLGRCRIVVPGDGTRQWQAAVTAVSVQTSRVDFTLEADTVELGSNTFVDATEVLLVWTDVGDEGSQGVQGDTGERGVIGGPIALPFVFSILTGDADPGNGNLRLDNATQELATTLRVDMLTSAGVNIGALLNSLDTLGLGTVKAIGSLVLASSPETNWLIFTITAQASPTGYRNLTISILDSSSANPFVDADAVVLSWIPVEKGDQGDTGATGAQGESFSPDFTVATIALRDAYDGQAAGTSVLVEEDSTNANRPTLYFLETPGTGSPPVGAVWSQGFDFAPGSTADVVSFDGTASGSASATVQEALDELFGTSSSFDIATEDVASAATTDIGATTSKVVRITGTTTITSFGSVINTLRVVRFNAALTLTHNATSLILLGGISRTVAAEDWGIYRSDASGNWREIHYARALHNPGEVGAPEVTVASAATTDIGASNSEQVAISGTTTITSFGTRANKVRFGRFTGALTLTHNATSLILPGGANITTAAGDTFTAESDASGNWRVLQYTRATAVPMRPTLHKVLAADETGQNINTAQPWFPTAGAVTVEANKHYHFRGRLRLTRSAGTTSHNTTVKFAGTAGVSYIEGFTVANDNDVIGTASIGLVDTFNSIAGCVAHGTSTSATEAFGIYVDGTIMFSSAGTFIPQFQYSAAPGGAPTVKTSTFFELVELGAATSGGWS
jgi:hypothetical protein